MTRLDRIVSGVEQESIGRFVVPWITCSDGFKVSVQASWGHYCRDSNGRRPDSIVERITRASSDPNGDAVLPYTAVEVGYPSATPEPWHCTAWSEGYDSHEDHPVCDGWETYDADGNGGIFAAVPVEMVHALIAAHGGEVE